MHHCGWPSSRFQDWKLYPTRQMMRVCISLQNFLKGLVSLINLDTNLGSMHSGMQSLSRTYKLLESPAAFECRDSSGMPITNQALKKIGSDNLEEFNKLNASCHKSCQCRHGQGTYWDVKELVFHMLARTYCYYYGIVLKLTSWTYFQRMHYECHPIHTNTLKVALALTEKRREELWFLWLRICGPYACSHMVNMLPTYASLWTR